MDKKIVKNISDQTLAIPSVGVVMAGEDIEVDIDFHNANFEEIKSAKKPETKKEKDEDETDKIKK